MTKPKLQMNPVRPELKVWRYRLIDYRSNGVNVKCQNSNAKNFLFLLLSFGFWISFVIWILNFGFVNISLASGDNLPVSLQAKLKREIDNILKNKHLAKAKVSIYISSCDNQDVLYKKNPDTPLVPASNMKIVTTACALAKLGPDYQFKTTVSKKGEIKDSTLSGDLIVQGGGDPNISGRFHNDNPTAIFKSWAPKLKKNGINKIKGNIILDDHIFDRQGLNPNWPKDQYIYWYSAEISGLSLNDNCIDISVYPTKVGSPAKISISPKTQYVRIINKCTTTNNKKKHLVSFLREPDKNEITVRGRVWTKSMHKYSVPIHNPALFFGTVLKETLEDAGIQVDGKVVLSEAPLKIEAKDTLIVETSKLTTAITVANKRSQNFYAEEILKLLGYNFKGKGTWDNGLKVLEEFVKKATHHSSLITHYSFKDGSGYSKDNKISSKGIVQLLKFMYKHKYKDIFISSLAISGVDGGLKNRLKDPPYKGRVFGKTGFIRRKDIGGASALSGYIKTKDSKVFCFSMLFNNFKCNNQEIKKIQDRIVEAVFDVK